MGTHFRYLCPQCQYQTQISGDFDRGFELHTATVSCAQCREVMDVALEREIWGAAVSAQMQGEATPSLSAALECKKEKAHEVRLWEGHCPRCGEELVRDPSFVFDWD